MAEDITSRIVELFEAARATPGAEYDESHFLDFLLAEARVKGAVRNSFRGLRRFNAFIETVQLEFGVCFSLKDLEANYSLDQFAKRTEELQGRPAGSKRSLQNQRRAGAGIGPMLVLNLILFFIGLYVREIWWALILVVLIAAIANIRFIRFAKKRRSYLLELEERIAKGRI